MSSGEKHQSSKGDERVSTPATENSGREMRKTYIVFKANQLNEKILYMAQCENVTVHIHKDDVRAHGRNSNVAAV